MEVYVLNANLSIVGILDDYNSLIWTERYAEAGDFELNLPASSYHVELLQQDRYLQIRDSKELMIIESISIKDENRAKKMTVTGRSLVSILDRRVVLGARYFNMETEEAQNDKNVWDIGKALVDENMAHPETNPIKDYPEGGIPYSDENLVRYHELFHNNRKVSKLGFIEPNNVDLDPYGKINSSDLTKVKRPIGLQFNGEVIYDGIKSLCDKYHLGFRIIYDYGTESPFKFYIYDGQNRTQNEQPERTDGTKNIPVILAPRFDNIAKISYSSTKQGFKSLLFGKGYTQGYKESEDPESQKLEKLTPDPYVIVDCYGRVVTNEQQIPEEPSGLELRELMADLSNDVVMDSSTADGEYSELTDAQYQKVLENRAKDVLNDNNKALEAFDGEIINNEQYKVKRDYDLGDIIEMNDDLGHSKWMRVVEVIYSHNSSGYKIYPTLALYEKDEFKQNN